MPDPRSIKSTPVALFEQAGIESVSLVFLTPAAAENLRGALQSALATADAQAQATWPSNLQFSRSSTVQGAGAVHFVSY
jgi:hypothetical protein